VTRFEEWKITTKAVLAATVVAAAVAAGVAGGRGTVEVHQTSASAPIDEVTTTTVPASTTSTEIPTTTTTAAPRVEERVIVIEKRVTEVENRVTKLESTTTTTPSVPEVRLVDNALGLADGPGTWTADFGRVLDFKSTLAMPGLKVTFKHYVTGDTGVVEIREFTAAFEDGLTETTYSIPGELTKATGHLEDIYLGIASVTWDGKQ
jgi:hypothetical protein